MKYFLGQYRECYGVKMGWVFYEGSVLLCFSLRRTLWSVYPMSFQQIVEESPPLMPSKLLSAFACSFPDSFTPIVFEVTEDKNEDIRMMQRDAASPSSLPFSSPFVGPRRFVNFVVRSRSRRNLFPWRELRECAPLVRQKISTCPKWPAFQHPCFLSL